MAENANSTTARQAHPLTLDQLCSLYWSTVHAADDPQMTDAGVERLTRRMAAVVRRVSESPVITLADLCQSLHVLAHEECAGADPKLSSGAMACMWRAATSLSQKETHQ